MDKRKSLFMSILIMVMIFSLVACSQPNDKTEEVDVKDKEEVESISIEDDSGNIIELEEPAEKIVSLAPSHTEILFALGLDDEILGVTEYCDYPEEALEKEKIGTFMEADMELIVNLSPDIVLASGEFDSAKAEVLEEADITVVHLDPQLTDDVLEDIGKIGILTGKVKEAKDLINEMEAKRDEILDKVADQEEVTVFYETWNDPMTAAAKGSFMDELITLVGGKNVIEDAENPYPQIEIEMLIDANPQVYLSADDGFKDAEEIKMRDGFDNIDAIKNDRIYLLDENISSRPGPRIMEALELVAQALYPEVFQ